VGAIGLIKEKVIEDYQKYIRKKALFTFAFIPFLIIIIGLSAALGTADISFLDVYISILKKVFPSLESKPLADVIVWKLRLTRITLGIITGMVLGITGTIMQGVLRNPVASPFTLGLSSAAGFGASLSIILGLNLIGGEYAIIGNAFVFSLLNAAFVISMTIRKKSKPETLILAGVAMHYLFTALTTLIQYFGKEEAVKAAMFWSVGDLGKANWSEITLVLILTILCLPILLSKSSELNIMRAGDEAAISLGVNVERTRKILL
jgi:iron complex transport system permease protein